MSPAPPSTSVPLIPLTRRVDGEWTVGGAIVFALVVVGVSQLVGLLLLQWSLGRMPASLEPVRGPRPAGAGQVFVTVQLTIQILQITLALVLAGWGGGRRLAALDLRPVRLGAGQWLALIVAFFVIKMVASTLAAGMSGVGTREQLEPFRALLREPGTQAIFLLTVVLAGLSEELVFRGVLSRTFETTRLGFWIGAGLVNGVFALVHLQYGASGQFVVFVIGMTLSWIRARTGSLWPTIVCHAANNAIAFLAMRSLL